MDPVTALGVASGILTFLTFSAALLKVGHGVCVTPSGRNEQNMTREVVLGETNAFLDQLMPADDPRLRDDEGLCRLVLESRRIAKDITAILEKVKPTKSGSVANLRSAIRHVLSKPDMEDLEKRMDQCRSQLDLHLNSGYFKNLKKSLDKILDQGDLSKIQLSQLQTSVDNLQAGITIESLSDKAQDQFRRLIVVQQESLDRTCQRLVLETLEFPNMHDRFDAVDPAHEKTFRWLLSDDHDYDFGSDSSPSDHTSLSSDAESSSGDIAESDDGAVADLDDEPGHSASALDNENLAPSSPQTLSEEAFHGAAHDSTELVLDSEHSLSRRENHSSQALSPHDDSDDTDLSHTESSHDGSSASSSEHETTREYSHEEKETATMRASTRRAFLDWLSASNEIFHFCGKLGSGKSTLMKYVLENERTQAELQTWAGEEKQLVCASFFFWKPGSKLQKSLPGLCRSLLHDILAARPDLIPSVLPTIWAHFMDHPYPRPQIEPQAKDIQNAFEKLIPDQNLYTHHRFCFFIDGLDEYEETRQQDHKSMVELLISWTKISKGNIKLCVSSREYNVFMNAFSDDRRLRVHDLTLHDIRSYIQDRLGHLPDDASKQSVVQDVASKANGIFLWVSLVVKSMREAIEDGLSVADLTDLLDSIPTELGDLFHHILKTLDKKKLRKACKTFEMLDQIEHAYSKIYPHVGNPFLPRLTLLAYSFLDDYERDPNFAVRDQFWKTAELGEAAVKKKLQNAAKQLRANCGGLLEARVNPDGERGQTGPLIDYTHRSVYEYLEEARSSREANLVLSDENFDPGDAASSLILAQIRALGPGNHDYAGLAILRLAGVAVPDQEPYEFLECIDVLTGKAGLHDVDECGKDEILVRVGGYVMWPCQRVSFPDNTGTSSSSPDRYRRVEPGGLDRPVLLALRHGFDDYVAWKLRHDPGVFDTSIKRMILADFFSRVSHPRDHPFLNLLVEAGVFNLNEATGFLHGVNSIGLPRDRWDTTNCAWFSSWRQTLVNVALDVLRDVAQSEIRQSQEFDRVGQLLEEYLKHGAVDVEMDIAITPGLSTLASSEGRMQIANVSFRFGTACLTWNLLLNSGSFFPSGTITKMNGASGDMNVLQWVSDISRTDIEAGKEISITFREFIRAVEFPNQDVLFSLLDGQVAKAVGEVEEVDEPTETRLVGVVKTASAEARRTNQSLWARMDADFAVAFGAGVLVSLAVVSVWAKYSLGVRGHS